MTQENVYGISGEIIAIDDDMFTLATPTLPVEGFVFDPNDRWIWQVSTEQASIIRHTINEEGFEDTAGGEDDLAVGMSVTVSSATDFSDQFVLFEKKIQASEIRIYE